MTLKGYESWNAIYNEKLSKVWQEERVELQLVAVLLEAFQQEFKKVQKQLDEQVSELKDKIIEKNSMLKKLEGLQITSLKSPSINSKNNSISSNSSKNCSAIPSGKNASGTIPELFKNLTTNKEIALKSSKFDSPDLFNLDNHCDNTDDEMLINESIIITSPALNKSKKSCKRRKKSTNEKHPKRNILMDVAINDIGDFHDNSNEDNDITQIDNWLENDNNEQNFQPDKSLQVENKRKVANENIFEPLNPQGDICHENELDTDVTYVKGFTQKETVQKRFLEKPKVRERLPQPRIAKPEPIVRGNARKYMNATTCKDCEKLYATLNIPLEQKNKIIKKCSKHRYVFQPPEETMEGFWDISFPDV